MLTYNSAWVKYPPLLDHRVIDWSKVTRARYFCYQRFFYAYPGPIRKLRQRLMVVPPERYGDQAVIEQHLVVAPQPTTVNQRVDHFGNRVWELHVCHVEREIAFETVLTVERAPTAGEQLLDVQQLDRFREPTALTTADAKLRAVAKQLAAENYDPEQLAERISGWVSDHMRYGSGSTGVHTTAAEALALGRGLCQDYAHIMLAICHEAGLAARYVSGHMLAEGGSHAWVEVLLPAGNGRLRALAFDPTNRRRPDLRYAIVAVGRDYRDVAPTSGSFTAPYSGRLQFTKRAGLTLVEFADGRVLGEQAA